MIDFDAVTELAVEAGYAIMEVYNRSGDIGFETKGDESPLTEADLAANEVITKKLVSMTPEIPIVSEEGNVGTLRNHHSAGSSTPSMEQRNSSRRTECSPSTSH